MNLMIADLEELKTCIDWACYDEGADQFSPMGWLAHKAGLSKTRLRDWPRVSSVTGAGDALCRRYKISRRELWQLEFRVQKAMGLGRSDPKKLVVEAIRTFQPW